MTDTDIHQHIDALVAEERRLRGAESTHTPADRERLGQIEAELDQYWDLLRQRDAKREFGADPESAALRTETVVESYEG